MDKPISVQKSFIRKRFIFASIIFSRRSNSAYMFDTCILHENKTPQISTWYDNLKLIRHEQKTAYNIQIETFKARA